MRHLLVSSFTAAAVLIAAAPAGAALPIRGGDWFNRSKTNGVSFESERRSVHNLQFFCNERRFEVDGFLRVSRDGTFHYRGKFRKYGPEASPRGFVRGRLRGRFTSPKRVKIVRSMNDCRKATVRATGKRSR